MSCSKPLPSFIWDSLYYLNRDRLERCTIVCRPLKKFIERYLHSKPYRVFDKLVICGSSPFIRGSFALYHNHVQWHPNRDDYSAQQFLAGEKCSVDNMWNIGEYYPLAEMSPYLGPSVRINLTTIGIEYSTFNVEHITEMESITYLWRDYIISFGGLWNKYIDAEGFQLILNSPTILQCRELHLPNVDMSHKDYKVLYTVKVIEILYYDGKNIELWQQYWQEFIEQPGVKPTVVFRDFCREDIYNFIDRLFEDFSSAVLPNAFKSVFVLRNEQLDEFYETNETSGEEMELKKGLPEEYQHEIIRSVLTSETVLIPQHLSLLLALENTIVERKKMHRAYRLTEKQDARLEYKAHEEANAKESRSGGRISNISSLDNGTMVEIPQLLPAGKERPRLKAIP